MRRSDSGEAAPLPVFLFPAELVFHSEQRSSHRKVLTLYNPYAFRISFKSQCSPQPAHSAPRCSHTA